MHQLTCFCKSQVSPYGYTCVNCSPSEVLLSFFLSTYVYSVIELFSFHVLVVAFEVPCVFFVADTKERFASLTVPRLPHWERKGRDN